MDAKSLKREISVERVFRQLGFTETHGKWRCPLPHNHTNGDQHPSVDIYQGERAFCRSQNCFGPKGADIFEIVGLVKNLRTYPEQKTYLEETFHLTNLNLKQPQLIDTIYDYTEKEGRLLFQVVRYQPKDFRQRRPDGKGGWLWNLKGIPMVLYRLPEVHAATDILLVEGERDVDTAYRLGLPEGYAATTSPMGAGKWRAGYSEFLRGKSVIICPDQDGPGARHGKQVAQALTGIAQDILWLKVPTGKDLSEWATSRRTTTEFHQLLKKATPFNSEQLEGNGLNLTSLEDLLAEPEDQVDWLVENLLPMGGVSVIGGKPKAGKSTTVRNLVTCVAKGEPFLNFPVNQGPVIYCAFEEKRGEVKKHFRDLGADCSLPIESFIGQAPENIVEKIRVSAQQLKPALIVLDTLAKVTRAKDFNDYAQMTQVLDPFLHVARETGAHLLFVHHAGKGDRSGGDALLGSTAIFGTVDTALLQKRSDKYRTLEAFCRYGHDLEETVLEWNEERRAITLGGSKKDTDVSRIKTDTVTFLQAQDEPLLREVIEEAIEGKTTHKRLALKQLVEAQVVTRLGKGEKGNPFTYVLTEKELTAWSQNIGKNSDAENSYSLVPGIYGEQGNKNPQNGQNMYEYKPDACSQDFGLFGENSDSRGQAFSCIETEAAIDLDA